MGFTLNLRLRCSSPASVPSGVEQLLKPPKDPETLPSCIHTAASQYVRQPRAAVPKHCTLHAGQCSLVRNAPHLRAVPKGVGRLEAQPVPDYAALTLVAALGPFMPSKEEA